MASAEDSADGGLPFGWKRKRSKSRPGNPWYYIHVATGETQWEKPESIEEKHKGEIAGEDGRPPQRQKRDEEHDAEEVRVLHLLKKHRGSRRPASWRNPDIQITKEEAEKLLSQLREQIVAAKPDIREKFEELAQVESDCSSAKRGGDLGSFGKGKMMPNFEIASFSLKPGELSEMVETDSGVHIIYRIA